MKGKEQKWIRAVLYHNSQDAANKLVAAYYDEIYAYVYRQVGNKEDALDLTQEGFIAMLQSLQCYNSRLAGFRTWLYHIVSHKVIDARRKARPEVFSLEEMDTEAEERGDFAEEMANRELLKEIEGYVSSFEPGIQEIYRLRLYGEQSFPEIAKAVGQSEAKIKAQYYRLLQKIRKEFGAYG